MAEPEWHRCIVCNPEIQYGDPCMRGTRIAVSVIVASLADLSVEELIEEYPQLTMEDVWAAQRFAAESK